MRNLLFILLLIICKNSFGQAIPNQSDFVFEVLIPANSLSFTIPTNSNAGPYNYSVDWGDQSTLLTGQTGNVTYNFQTAGTYTIRISGQFPQIYFQSSNDNTKLISIDQWGTISWASFNAAFFKCYYLVINATDAPDLSSVNDLYAMFYSCFSITTGNFANWNVSTITDMSSMFNTCSRFNDDISSWQMGNVIYMSHMFDDCTQFNQDISGWNTSSVNYMPYAFFACEHFNQSLANWNIANVYDMTNMLINCNLSVNNYDATLTGWQAGPHQSNIRLDATNQKYCSAATAHDLLTGNNSGWTINGDINLNTTTIPPILVDNGAVKTSNDITCFDKTGYVQLIDGKNSEPLGKYIAINPNTNTGYGFKITAANNGPVIKNQSRTNGSTNTTALSNRMYTLEDTLTNSYSTGITVRIYYSDNDITAATNSLDHNVAGAITSQWFEYPGGTHLANEATILARQVETTVKGATLLTPSATGTENGVNYVEFSGITSAGTFGYLAARTVYALPVTLVNFTATSASCVVDLAWQTASEQNTNYYAVETSINGTNFTQVTKLKSKNSATGSSYNYTYNAATGINYFRLKSVDVNGKFTYSPVVTAAVNCNTNRQIVVSPNPAINLVNIQSVITGSTIRLYDLQGKKLMETKANNTNQSINIAPYAKGIYLLNIQDGNGNVSSVKVVKL